MVADHTPRALPKLKPDLRFSANYAEGELVYIVEDPVVDRFFRVGSREYDFLIQLDGRRSIQQALVYTNRMHASAPLVETDVESILAWASQENLLESNEQGAAQDTACGKPGTASLGRANLMFIRLPLWNPDRFLSQLVPKISWLLGSPFLWCWFIVVASGAYQVASHWHEFEQSSAGIFYPYNWLWLLFAYIVLKTAHEIFHGLITKKYGGQVTELGVILILFIPLGYVNGSSAWHFPRKMQRFYTAVAGIVIELFFAGLAGWVWVSTSTGVINDIAFNVMIIASVSTLLFNANPLMRFDGYFALSDILNLPNLYLKGQSYVHYLAKRFLFGLAAQDPVRGRLSWFVRCYGIAACCWKLIVMVSLFIAAYSLFYGAGLIVAVLGAIALLMPIARRLIRQFSIDRLGKKATLLAGIRAGAVIVGLVMLATQIKWQRDIVTPGVVDYPPSSVIYVGAPGFLRELKVRSGAQVSTGQPLAVLDNKPLVADIERLKLEIKISELIAKGFLGRADTAKLHAEREKIAGLKKQLAIKLESQNRLIITAPFSGIIVTSNLEDSLDQYFREGEPLLRIGREGDKALYFSIGENEPYDADRLGEPLAYKLTGRAREPNRFAVVDQVIPRVTTAVDFPQLTAPDGGSLAVKGDGVGGYEFTQPRTRVSAKLAAGTRDVRAGSRVKVRLHAKYQSLGNMLTTGFSRWIRHLLAQEKWH
ncbi:MAG: hypothetical protein AAF387_01830 [Pseudomonadota bacterium]